MRRMMLDNCSSRVYRGKCCDVVEGGVVAQRRSIRIGQMALVDCPERRHSPELPSLEGVKGSEDWCGVVLWRRDVACELVYSEKDPQLSIGATYGITFWKELRKVSTQPARACNWG